MAIDIVDAMAEVQDPGLKDIIGFTKCKTYSFKLFQVPANAYWVSDRLLKEQGYPAIPLSFVANRNLFRYQVGDVFKYTSVLYPSIVDMVFRIQKIKETNLEKEEITVEAIQDVNYISSETTTFGSYPVGASVGLGPFGTISTIGTFRIKEALYFMVKDDTVAVIPLVAKETGNEWGFVLFMSTDNGASYSAIATITGFPVHGTLASVYPASTFDLDDEVGFDVDINIGADFLTNITRDKLFGKDNLSILGDEYITWQTITPHETIDNRYTISGVYRGRYNSEKSFHYTGEDFWFIKSNLVRAITHDSFSLGVTRYFKVVPFGGGNISGELSDAVPEDVTFTCEAFKPYTPSNFAADDIMRFPEYTGGDDIVLSWVPRVRGDGAGLQNPDYITDAEPVWEGLFEIEVWVNNIRVRVVTGIDDDEWTYTNTMNVSDNGIAAGQITFKLKNYRTLSGNIYSSDWVQLVVNKE